MRSTSTTASGLSLALICCLPGSLQAQATGASQAIEEVVVTTRRREERLQEVPIAVTAIGEAQIQQAGIRGINDIAQLSPSLVFNENFSQNDVRITVRGLTNTRGRSNIAFLVDGIDVTSETTGTNAGSPLLVNQRLLTDVERIEVVRGPQSALYGRAAFAGAISYVTRDPGDRFQANGSVDIADDGGHEVAAGISGPIGALPLGFGFNGVTWSEDGHYQNAVSGADFGGGSGDGATGALVFAPNDDFKVRARVTWSEDEYAPRPVARIPAETTLAVPQEAIDAGVTSTTQVTVVDRIGSSAGFDARASEDPLTGGDYPGTSLEVARASLVATWDVGSVVLSSYTGLTSAELDQRYDVDRQADGRPDTFLAHGEVDTEGETDQFSQELRLASAWDLPVQATIGGLIWQEDREDHARNMAVGCVIVTQCTQLGYSSWQEIYAEAIAAAGDYRNPTLADTDHWSIYAMLEWQITDSLTLSVEDRYVDEDFSATIFIGQSCSNLIGFAIPSGGLGCAPGEEYSDTVNTTYHAPRVTLDWQVNDQVLVYASAARGVKPGGISLLTVPLPFTIPTDTFLYDPEKLWGYELGTKTQWDTPVGALLVNASAFYNDYTDKQTNTTTAFPPLPIAVPQVTNASSAHVLGFELEAAWQTPVEGLQVTLAWTWLEAEYDDFLDPTRSSTRMAIAGECARIENVGVLPHCFVDLSGNELEAAPAHAVVGSVAYRRPLPGRGWSLLADATARYQDSYYTSQDNYTRLESYWIADLRLGLESERWTALLYVDNVFDDDQFKVFGGNPDFGPAIVGNPGAVGSFETTGLLPDPRILGARISFRY